MSHGSTQHRECFQCGRTEFVMPDDPAENPWIVCYYCGERVISFAELKEMAKAAEEDRIRKNLKVEEFLESRRVNRNG